MRLAPPADLGPVMFPDLFRDDVFRLETARLWLRWPMASDAKPIAHLLRDPAIAAMTARLPSPYSLSDAEAFVLATRAANAQGDGLGLVLASQKRPGVPLGCIELRVRGEDLSIGYWLGQPSQGQGLMREAVEALVSYQFLFASFQSVRARVRTDNPASRRVLEACSFELQGRECIDFPARGQMFLCDVLVREREPTFARRAAHMIVPARDKVAVPCQ